MKRTLTADQFEALLHRLGPDRDRAGIQYEQLRQRLLSLFTYRRCQNPEDLVDETLDRVARRLLEIAPERISSDPGPFVFGVAWNIVRESFKQQRTVAMPDRWEPADSHESDDAEAEKDREHECLDRCLGRLRQDDRELVLRYFQEERRAKIRQRSILAQELAVSANALRLRVHRITTSLRSCVAHCGEART